MKQYIDKKVAILCTTAEESREINKLIVEHGGRDLHYQYNGGNHYYGMEEVSQGTNCQTNGNYYERSGYLVIPASEILSQSANYQIF